MPFAVSFIEYDWPGSRLWESNSAGPDCERIRCRSSSAFTNRIVVPAGTVNSAGERRSVILTETVAAEAATGATKPAATSATSEARTRWRTT